MILCDAIADQRRELPEVGSFEPSHVHLKSVFDAYMKLLSNCKEVECIETHSWARTGSIYLEDTTKARQVGSMIQFCDDTMEKWFFWCYNQT